MNIKKIYRNELRILRKLENLNDSILDIVVIVMVIGLMAEVYLML